MVYTRVWYLFTKYSSLTLKRGLAIVITVPRDYKIPSRLRSWLGNQIFRSLEIETLIEEFQNHKEKLNSSVTNTSINAKCIETKSIVQSVISLSLSLSLSLPLSLSLGKSLNHVRICIHGNFLKHLFEVLYAVSAFLHFNIFIFKNMKN